MVQVIKLIIRENDKVLETVTKETSTLPSHLIKSLEQFQQSANVTITKLIENLGSSGDVDVMDTEGDEESDGDDEDNVPVSPRKKKK